jgi:hypothetical protein
MKGWLIFDKLKTDRRIIIIGMFIILAAIKKAQILFSSCLPLENNAHLFVIE